MYDMTTGPNTIQVFSSLIGVCMCSVTNAWLLATNSVLSGTWPMINGDLTCSVYTLVYAACACVEVKGRMQGVFHVVHVYYQVRGRYANQN